MALVLALTLALVALAALAGLRRSTFWLMAARPACDQAFNLVKFALGQESGPGAALNILVLTMAAAGVLFRPSALASPVVLAWGAFVAAAGASAAVAPDPASSMRLLLTLSTYGAVLILADVLVRDRASAAAALGVCLLSSVIPAAVAVVELALMPSILTGDERLLGTFTHPNILAFYLVTMIGSVLFVLATTLVKLPTGWRRGLYVWAALLVVLLLATKTRSAWIAVGLIVIAQAALVDRRWLGLLALSPLVLLVPGVGERFFDLFEGNTNDTYAQLNSLAWRQLLWADTFSWLTENPPGLLGHGLDHYVSYVPVFFQRGANPEGIGTHNALLQLYFEAGWLGLTTFLGAYAVVLTGLALRWRADPKATPIAIALLLGILVCSYSDNMLDYLQFQWPFWFFIGTICAAGRHVDVGIDMRLPTRQRSATQVPRPA
jgi:O-antigen ligase